MIERDAAKASVPMMPETSRSSQALRVEIRALLRLREDPSADCTEVGAILHEQIGHVAARIRELRELDRHLKALRQQCARVNPAATCGML